MGVFVPAASEQRKCVRAVLRETHWSAVNLLSMERAVQSTSPSFALSLRRVATTTRAFLFHQYPARAHVNKHLRNMHQFVWTASMAVPRRQGSNEPVGDAQAAPRGRRDEHVGYVITKLLRS